MNKLDVQLAFHDICAENFQEVQSLLEELATKIWGKTAVALMVVPRAHPSLFSETENHLNFSFSGGLESNTPVSETVRQFDKEIAKNLSTSFSEFLTHYQASGSLIFQHGLSHFGDKDLPRKSFGKKVNEKCNNEAEFAGLDQKVSQQLLSEAMDCWTAKGLPKADGFVPPTWHAPKFLRKLCLQNGFQYYESRLKVICNSKSWFSVPMSFWGQDLDAFQLSLSWNLKLFQFCKATRIPMRLALHPSDFHADKKEITMDFLTKLSEFAHWRAYPTILQ